MDIDSGRQGEILSLLLEQGKVRVSELSKRFGISEVTIRKDLGDMEDKGVVQRIHGGAISTNRAYYHMSLNERRKTNIRQKQQIGSACAAKIKNGETLLINSGTTAQCVVAELKRHKDLTIITNSVAIAHEACNIASCTTILLGGCLDEKYEFTYGDDTLRQLKLYKADKTILSADGVHPENGVTTFHHREAEMYRMMMQHAFFTIVVADSSKVGNTALSYIEDVAAIDCLITNENCAVEHINALSELGLDIELAQ